MKLTSFALTSALLATFAAAPVVAQERDAHRREAARAQQNERQGQPHEQARSAQQAQPRAEAPRVEQAQPRRDEGARVQQPRAVQPPAVAPRAETRPNEAVVGRAVPRTAPLYNSDRERYDRERAERNRAFDRDRAFERDRRVYGYTPRVYAPRSVIVPRPYVFRPRLSIGFGIYAGFPVPYSWRYSAPIYVYGYRAPTVPVYIQPGMTMYGGVALEISPYDADVFVDGAYAGKVQDFDGTVQPLTVLAGTHRIEVQAPGYAPLVFDVTVAGGQVVPYQGDLRPF